MTDTWTACLERAQPGPLAGEVLRLVESQEQVATNHLVRTLAEQALLEELLETTKPALPAHARTLHYLLATPFRYPPLRYGSRFGRRTEPALFYASRTIDAVLAECAYYRFVFWSGMVTPPPRAMTTQHSLFGVPIRSELALRLQAPPFDVHREPLTHRGDYHATQLLGTRLRELGVEAFEYVSARDAGGGINVALFTARALAATKPSFVEEWLCETDAGQVRYYSRGAARLWQFRLDAFTVDGRLPAPAVQ